VADDLPPDWIHKCSGPCEISNDVAVIHGSAAMFIPAGGNHVRQIALRVPADAFKAIGRPLHTGTSL